MDDYARKEGKMANITFFCQAEIVKNTSNAYA